MRSHLLAAAPGVAALAVALVALGQDEGAGTTRTVTVAGAPATGGAGGADRTGTLAATELFARVEGAVARLDARRPPGAAPFGNGRRSATGTAWLLDRRGHLVTNAHVVEGATRATVRFGSSSRRVAARIVGRDPANDLAVLRVPVARVRGEAPLPLAPADGLRVGDPVLAIGTPFRLQSSASTGIVSALGRQIRGLTGFTIPDALQTDAAINPGNSGGPLLDAQGRVVGVNTQGAGPGVSFAVGAATLRRVLPQLVRDGRARTGYLGLRIGEVTEAGTRLEGVTAGSPAARAGLRSGDVVRRAAGRPVSGEGDLARAIAATRPGAVLELVVRRDGRDRTVRARVGTQPRRA
jgi:S1-C subfamily serine protease